MGLVPRERRQIYLGRGALEVFAVGEISLSLLKKKKKEFSSNERTQQYSPRDFSIKGIGKERGYYVHA